MQNIPNQNSGLRCVLAPFAVAVVAGTTCFAFAASPSREHAEFFETKIRPILVEKCQRCHGPQRQKGGLRLDSRESVLKGGDSGPAIVPGKPASSELVRAINYEADGFQMPPTGKIDADAIAALTEWVRLGAPWPAGEPRESDRPPSSRFDFAQRARHWSFQPLRIASVPGATDRSWARNPVDRFIESRLEEVGGHPAPPADRRTLLRRVTFDLIGLPPTREEIADFVADRSPTAYETVVDRLLASPHYGVRWGRHWLDLVRFAETYGHEFDFEIPAAWPYRDYVVRAWNEDLRYDRFVTEHVAGDLLAAPRLNLNGSTNESIIGTAFWWFSQAKHSPVDLRAEECDTIDNQIDVFGKAFLGLSIACARCHDHKFDPIRTQDYYALAGFLESSRQQVAVLDNHDPIERALRRRQSRATQFADSMASIDPQTAIRGPNRSPFETELAALRRPSPFADSRRQLAEQLRRQSDDARNSRLGTVVFTEFSAPTFKTWRVTGPAFGDRPSRAGDLVLSATRSAARIVAAPHASAHSGLISTKLRGAISSPTFIIEKPYIQVRAARGGPENGPARPFKFGQINAIVDGFQIIRNPLYGGLSVSVHCDVPAAWYTIDVSKFIGHRAYLEIVDEDDGWIAVDSVAFSDHPQPPRDPPNALLTQLVTNESIDTPAKLADASRELVADTLRLWRSDRLAADPHAADRVAILNWLCRQSIVAEADFGELSRVASFGGTETDGRSSSQLVALLSDWVAADKTFNSPARALAMADGSPFDAHVLVRGNAKKPGDLVSRRFLEVFGSRPAADEAGSGRLELARQLTGRAAPLVARVLVNRLWLHHFGRGIVATPDDFGKMGELPTHPQLLDFLAAELMRGGWSIKRLQRLMVLSSAYRMASVEGDPRTAAIDPENRWLHRMPVRRLEAEIIRDSILAISGRLNERLDGPSIPVHLDPFMTGRGRPALSGPLDGNGRRSLYLQVRRNFLTPMFLAFDYPTPFTTAGRRATSNVPAQALALLNNPFVVQQAAGWAHAMVERTRDAPSESSTIDGEINALYESAFARRATTDERIASRRFLAEQPFHPAHQGEDGAPSPQAWSDLCHVLMNTKEFIYIR